MWVKRLEEEAAGGGGGGAFGGGRTDINYQNMTEEEKQEKTCPKTSPYFNLRQETSDVDDRKPERNAMKSKEVRSFVSFKYQKTNKL